MKTICKDRNIEWDLFVSQFKNRKDFNDITILLSDIMIKRLSDLNKGEKAIIQSFDQDEIYLKLMEMGCVPGEEVVIENRAPLGDPISIKVAGYALSLREEEAEKIWVETVLIH
jgi:ferrous iron transport protein A